MAQNLFASDTRNIYQFTPSGAYTLFTTSPFGNVRGLAFDSAGNLYYADGARGAVVKVAPDGTSTIFATGLTQPSALAFNSAGDLFVSEVPGSRASDILEFSPNGARTVFATGLGAPAHMTFNSAGDLFVSDNSGVSPIYRFAPKGTRSTFATITGQGIDGLAFNSAGDLFIGAGGDLGYIYRFAPDGTRTTFASGLQYPIDLAFNQSGDLFVSEFGTAPYILRFGPNGTRAGFTSAMGAQGLAFQVPEPSTLAIAAAWGFLIASRRLNKRISGHILNRRNARNE